MNAKRLDKIFSFLFYLFGVASFFFIDVAITKGFDHVFVAYWADFKSIISIGVIFCLFGLDHVVVRFPAGICLISRRATLQVLISAALIATLFFVSDFFPDGALLFFSLSAVSFSMLLMQHYRMGGKHSIAQLLQHGWKVLLLLLIFLQMALGSSSVGFLYVLLATFLPFFLLGIFLIFRLARREFIPSGDGFSRAVMVSVGGRYFFTSVLLVFSVYLEQLVVSAFYSDELAAQYFAMSVYFLFPVSLLNGFFSFNVGPWIRNNRVKFDFYMRNYISRILIFFLFYVLACALAGFVVWHFFIGEKFHLDLFLVVLFSISALLKTAYIIPSGFFAVESTLNMHDWLIGRFTFSLFLAAVFFIVAHYIFSAGYISVAVAAMLNLLLRCFFAYRAMFLWGNFREQ